MDKDSALPIGMVETNVFDLIPSAMPIEAVRHDFPGNVVTPENYGNRFVDSFRHAVPLVALCEVGVNP